MESRVDHLGIVLQSPTLGYKPLLSAGSPPAETSIKCQLVAMRARLVIFAASLGRFVSLTGR